MLKIEINAKSARENWIMMSCSGKFRDFTFLVLLIFATSGCEPPPPAVVPKSLPSKPTPLTQFGGRWLLNFDKTIAVQKAAGDSGEQMEQLREVYASNPRLKESRPSLAFSGNVATSAGLLTIEYRFFALHQHGSKVCGQCWHMEDRSDPGDVSKCYVRLSIVDGDLHLELNMLEEPPDPNDPDLVSPALEGDISKCEADQQKAENWDRLVFSRGI